MDVPAATTRIENLWYDDGSVILVAGTSAFRVHCGILSQYSSVFRDLFMVPQPPPNECPQMILSICNIL
ncbi:hypothetical protein BKA93DRAFT_745237 [Sparassis latifolia]